jgi:hypothetical protein
LTVLHTLGIKLTLTPPKRGKDRGMARALDVHLHNDLVGQLAQDDGGDLSFQYAETWLPIRKRCATATARFRS